MKNYEKLIILAYRFKGRDRLDMAVELKEQYCIEKNNRIHLIPMRHFYGVKFLNNRVKAFVTFHQLFQSAEETFLKLFNKPDPFLETLSKKILSLNVRHSKSVESIFHYCF